jgi:hypothetical protein
MSPLILKRAPIGWNQDDYDVLEDGVIVGRILKVPIAPQDQPWMWTSGHNGEIRRAAHGYEPTREAAMAAFAKSWRRERLACRPASPVRLTTVYVRCHCPFVT